MAKPVKSVPPKKKKSDHPVTWRAIFFIWLLATPFVAGVGLLAYQKNPAPFHTAAGMTMKGVQMGVQSVKNYQAQEAAKKAKAAAEAKKKEAPKSYDY